MHVAQGLLKLLRGIHLREFFNGEFALTVPLDHLGNKVVRFSAALDAAADRGAEVQHGADVDGHGACDDSNEHHLALGAECVAACFDDGLHPCGVEDRVCPERDDFLDGCGQVGGE